MTTTGYRKVLSQYYHKWFRDCYDSAVYCEKLGDTEKAKQYLEDAKKYFDIINENWFYIEFFSQGHNAFTVDWMLPKEYRGIE